MNIGWMRTISQRLIRQIIYFFIAGISAVCVDYLVYRITSIFMGTNISKIFGFYSGVVVSFVINGSYTFQKIGKSFLTSFYFFRYMIFLTFTMIINVMVNYYLLFAFSSISNITLIAFSIATLISMFLNFLFIKLMVFK